MTGRPVFGDFLTAARDHASVAAARPETDRGGDHVQEVTDSLLYVITVMGRYLHDIAAVPGDMRSPVMPPMTAWGRARINARDAIANAAGHLRPHSGGRRAPGVTARSELARRLDAAAVSLTAGRDLLGTHLARDPRGARQFRSEWALVLCSPPAKRALLAELASLARQITPPCMDLALSSSSPDTAAARRSLHRACGWLQVFSACVQTAQRDDPVPAADRDLLHAIPVNAALPRPVLDGAEPVTSLYDAVITSAERARHAAWVTSAQPAAHHACDAVTSLAYAERERIRTAASAYRLLVPTRSLPDTIDIPRPFAPALRDHVYALLSLCQDTAAAAAEASKQAGEAAAAVGAPSQVLTTARAAASAGRDASPGGPRPAAGEPAFAGQPRELTGAVQKALYGLGITSPGLLQRAADIDYAAEQLIIDAAEQRGLHQNPPSLATPNTPASTPALTHGAYTSDDPRAATRQHHPAPGHQHEQPEAEP